MAGPPDWKFLAAFHKRPDATLARGAADSRVSPKTTAKLLHLLLDVRACWRSHSAESEEWPFALLAITLQPGAVRSEIAREIAAPNDCWIPTAPDGLGSNPQGDDPSLTGLAPITCPTALERAVRRMLAIVGVVRVRRTFGLGSASYSHWFDEQLAAQVLASA